jgi:putative transposase
MLRTHKIALDVNNRQATHLSKAAGVSRFAYNWGLDNWNRKYVAHQNDNSFPKPNISDIRKELNQVKRTDFPWMMDVTKYAPRQALMNLGKAWNNFFAGKGKRPTFHKKGVSDSFYVGNDQGKVDGMKLYIPKLGWIRMRESLRYENAKILGYVISRRAGRWYVSINCEILLRPEVSKGTGEALGIDVGVSEFVCSDGNRYEVPRSYKTAQRQLQRAQKSLSRKAKGSKNRDKARRKIAKLHASTANIRNDFLHKLTTEIVSKGDIVVIEDLNVKGMLKNRHLAKSIADASFGEFRRQLSYKMEDENKCLVVADRFFPSSKLCSACGAKTKHLPLSKREWTCTECKTHHDRDMNAAVNLKIYADSSAASVCGGIVGKGSAAKAGMTTAPVKQKLNSKSACR